MNAVCAILCNILVFMHFFQPQEGAHTGKAMSGDLGKIDTGMHKHRGAKQIAESGFVHLFTGYWPRSNVRLTSIVDVHFSSLLFPIHSSPLFSLLSSQPNPRSSDRVPDGLSFCLATCHRQQDQSSSLTSPSFRRVVWSVFGRSLTASRSSQDKITTKSRWCRFQEVNPSASRL